ncbi:hypothetical protein LXL04_016626 [Taraxacum kok-saghyz]
MTKIVCGFPPLLTDIAVNDERFSKRGAFGLSSVRNPTRCLTRHLPLSLAISGELCNPSPSSSGEPSQLFFCCLPPTRAISVVPPTRASSYSASFFIRCELSSSDVRFFLRRELSSSDVRFCYSSGEQRLNSLLDCYSENLVHDGNGKVDQGEFDRIEPFSSQLHEPLKVTVVVECCGSPAIIRNTGRLFYACSKQAPQCGFLGWVEDEKTIKSFNQKDLIIELGVVLRHNNYGFDFLGNITFSDFVQSVKCKTGMGRKGGISLHYEHLEMHYVIKMVDDNDFDRLKRRWYPDDASVKVLVVNVLVGGEATISQKIPFLNDNEIIPGANPGNAEEDFFIDSDIEINDSEDQSLGDDYSEGFQKNYFHNMLEVPTHDPVYAPVSSVRLGYKETIKVLQLFQTKQELIDSLGIHAIYEQKQFRTVKSTKSRKHTCSSTQLNPNHRQATKKVLGTFVAEVYSKTPNRAYTGKDIVADINLRYKIQITYHQAWRAKKFAMELLRGTHEESFAKLPVYCHNLKIHNPGTVTYIQTDESERSTIVVDSAHLKGEYKGDMLVAVGTDGNNQILPIAFVVCRSETNENWILFFQKLYESIDEIHGLCVISDRNQGIANACALIFPNAKHGVCGKHVHRNVVQKRGESSKTANIFWKATKAYTIHTFNHFYDLLHAHEAMTT